MSAAISGATPEPAADSAALRQVFDRQRQAFLRQGAPSYEQRLAALDRLKKAIHVFRDDICRAISEDFGNRSWHESMVAEVMTSLDTVKHARKHLKRWMKPEKRPLDRTKFALARARVHYQPLGVVGIISPWNYPIYLALSPLVAAIAAGNRVMLKPSELTPRSSDLLARMIAENFDPAEVAVVTGDARLGQDFSRLPFDHLLFTGSTAVGRKVAQAAAENMTPVTLELGGKSPTIVADDYPLERAVDSIMAGKLLNAGQTCIAPDYVFVPRRKRQAFVELATGSVARMYPTLAANPDYTSIVADRHYDRLQNLLADARQHGLETVSLNPQAESLSNQRKIAPTLVLDPPDSAAVMREEIFGPVLPVKSYDDLNEVIDYVNAHDRPLALYLFSNDEQQIDRVLQRTTSGGVTINDTLYHVAAEDLPFGGVGPSGIGAYHGREGFRTFSHAKGTFYQSKWNAASMLRPPYGAKIERLLKFMVGKG
ncbi:MAG: coniferyl aldehyde dehydrogenase [Reyranellaceae bacterium]